MSDAISVRYGEPFLVAPAEPTPKELKEVSVLDYQEGLRMRISLIMFYRRNPKIKKETDPAKAIMRGISRALVQYYPLAGRLIEEVGPNGRKLFVDCNGEGVLFIEANADVSLEDLGDSIGPPCPHINQFLHHMPPGSDAILGCPLLLFQVTRLWCGGFVLAILMNHIVCDSYGLAQFLNMVGALIEDPHAQVLPPVWQRQIFTARNPPRVTCIHHEYEDNNVTSTSNIENNMAHESIFLGPKQMHALKNLLPNKLRKCSTLELVSACLWKCRTLAFEFDPDEVVALSCFITAHGKVTMPNGYYGNAFVFPAAISEAGSLCQNPLGYALELVREAKLRVNEEYIRSLVDFIVVKGRPMYRNDAGNFLVGDMTRVGFESVDFGWGKPVYGGPVGAFPLISYLARFRNSRGEDGIVVPIMLPMVVMKRFLMEVVKMTSVDDHDEDQEESVNCYYYHQNNDQIMETRAMSKL